MSEKSQPNPKKFGVIVLLILFLAMFGLLSWRFFVIQIRQEVSGEKLEEKIKQLQMKSEIIQANRGSIYDSDNQLIASDSITYRLIAVLSPQASVGLAKGQYRHVVDYEKTARVLAKYTELSEASILQSLTTSSDNNKYQVEFGEKGRNLSRSTKELIDSFQLPGIQLVGENNRYYQNGYFASHVIGYTQLNEDKEVFGVLGLEKYYDDYLKGKNGLKQYPTDRKGEILPDGVAIVSDPDDGKDIHTTINKNIQTLLENLMTKVDTEFNPEKMVAIVMDPKTGGIIAMSQRPSFDLETREGIGDKWSNIAVEEIVEPGSTFKMFTWAAAINENAFDPNETFMSGEYAVVPNESPIRDHNYGRGWGEISFLKGLQLSSNVGFAKIGMEKLGPDKMMEYMTRFGFDEKTGIDLPREANSRFSYRYKREQANTMFGQGTAVTPIQLVQAATAIANGGKMVKPYFVEKVVDRQTEEIVYEATTTVVSEPITQETAEATLAALETAVSSPDGTGRVYQLSDSGIKVAGKTGTAQIPKKTGGYQIGHQNYLFSFLGMAPAEDPEVLIYVAVQKPEINSYQSGSVPVSEIFIPLMDQSLKYLTINEKELSPINDYLVTLPDFSEEDLDLFRELNNETEIIVLGDPSGTFIAQSPERGKKVLLGEKVIILYDGQVRLPDLEKWSYRDVKRLGDFLEIPITFSGEGFVFEQSVEVGTLVDEINGLEVVLRPGEDIPKMELEEVDFSGELTE